MSGLTFGSLFSGIGGFDLGFERAGMVCKWQVEIDPFCNRVLAKHWPEVKRYGDINTIDWTAVEPIDVLCGGFPCQPHSTAGARKASEDERDLWPEFKRAICELGPEWVVAENVGGIFSSETGRFFGGILRDLDQSGYDAEWQVLPASAFGAPHQRERVFIVAYPQGLRRGQGIWNFKTQPKLWSRGMDSARTWPYSNHDDLIRSGFVRIHDGIPNKVDRLRSLGNAVVPQVAEWIGRRIVEACNGELPRLRTPCA